MSKSEVINIYVAKVVKISNFVGGFFSSFVIHMKAIMGIDALRHCGGEYWTIAPIFEALTSGAIGRLQAHKITFIFLVGGVDTNTVCLSDCSIKISQEHVVFVCKLQVPCNFMW